MLAIDKIYNEDCLEGMKRIADGSVDFVCTDLPFGIVDCDWDKKINLAEFWTQIKRVLKPTASAALFASGKFSYELAHSNWDWFKYRWTWVKNVKTGFVHAKNCPMRQVEDILIFSDGAIAHEGKSKRRMKYFPQGVHETENGKPRVSRKSKHKFGGIYGSRPSNKEIFISTTTGYPTDLLTFKALRNGGRINSTQKPVDLIEYLIKTYTNEGETVLDATIGSGTTAVAAINTGRHFIGFETEKKFFDIANERIAKSYAEKEQSLIKE